MSDNRAPAGAQERWPAHSVAQGLRATAVGLRHDGYEEAPGQLLVIKLWPLPGQSADGLLGGVAAGCFALMIPTAPVSSHTRRRLILRVPIAVGLIGMLDFVAWKIGPPASITFGLIYAAIAAAAIYALTEISSESMPILNSDARE